MMTDFRGERRMATNPFDNPEFREEMSAALQNALKPIIDTQEKHGDTLEKHDLRLDAHDGKFNRQAGGFAVLLFLGGLMDALIHWKWGK